MNERIKQLAVQTQEYANQQWVDAGFPNWEIYHETLAEDHNKKFAELIIRECAQVSFDHRCNGTNKDSAEMSILKHFGVA